MNRTEPAGIASFHNNLSEADKARALLNNMQIRGGLLSDQEQEWLAKRLEGWAQHSDRINRLFARLPLIERGLFGFPSPKRPFGKVSSGS